MEAVMHKVTSGKKGEDNWKEIEIEAEKFETIISRGILNTRARDFYDIYILTTLQEKNINKDDFKNALTSTATKRETLEKINDSSSIIEEIKEDKTIQGIWKAYTKRFVYANDIAFEDSIAALIKLFEMYSNNVLRKRELRVLILAI